MQIHFFTGKSFFYGKNESQKLLAKKEDNFYYPAQIHEQI